MSARALSISSRALTVELVRPWLVTWKMAHLGAVEDGGDRVGHVGDVLDDGGAGELEAAEEALVLHDLDVGGDIKVGGEADEELGEDAGKPTASAILRSTSH